MRLVDANFKRRFCVNYYRNLTLPMGEMSMHKDWVNAGRRGDPYPITDIQGDASECIANERYTVNFGNSGSVRRLLGAFMPWLTYDVEYEKLSGEIGFALTSPIGEASVLLSECGTLTVSYKDIKRVVSVEKRDSATLSVSFRGLGVSVFCVKDGVNELLVDLADDFFASLRNECNMCETKIHLIAHSNGGETVIKSVNWYLSAGISQADIRPVRYEDATPIIEGGRVFLTATARCVEYKYQVVLSWCPSTCDFKLEGALFFDVGDGMWCDDVASSLIYDRTAGIWRIAMCTFSHDHTIAIGKCESDPRFGINIIDVTPMEKAKNGDSKEKFVGFVGDEDPDMILIDGKWRFAVCRCEDDGYHYYHFVSDDLESFEFVARSEGCEKTGGSYVRAADGVYFVCGSDFNKRAVYDVYSLDNLNSPIKNLTPDYDDGGFRGWGSVMMLPCGSRYKYTWITFDRHLGSHFNWSYGNIHVFDSETFKT